MTLYLHLKRTKRGMNYMTGSKIPIGNESSLLLSQIVVALQVKNEVHC